MKIFRKQLKIYSLAGMMLFMVLSCSRQTMQAPAFYAAPEPAETVEVRDVPQPKQGGKPDHLPPLQSGGDTVSLPEPSPKQPRQTAATQVVPPVQAEVQAVTVAEAVADSLAPGAVQDNASENRIIGRPIFEPSTALAGNAADTAGANTATVLPATADSPALVPNTEAQPAPARERTAAAPESAPIIIPAPANTMGEQQQQQLQLLAEQNRLLQQQLQNMQTQQTYYQQQNDRLLAIALANRQQVDEQQQSAEQQPAAVQRADTITYQQMVRRDSTQAYPLDRYPLQTEVVNAEDSAMQAQVRQLNQAVAQLQLSLESPTRDSNTAQADTALISTIQQLRQQIAALQPVGSDSVPQMAPLNLYFASGVSSISEEALANLQAWAAQVKDMPAGASIVLNGFTDKSGSAELNLRLAGKRVQAVKAALINAGVPQGKILSGYLGIDLQQQDLAHARRVQLVLKP